MIIVDFSLIGAVVIIMGLYTVVWGKSKDPKGSHEVSSGDEMGKVQAQELPITIDRQSNPGRGLSGIMSTTYG